MKPTISANNMSRQMLYYTANKQLDWNAQINRQGKKTHLLGNILTLETAVLDCG